MKSLQQIIDVLRPSEMALIRLYLKRQTNAEDKLRLTLLNIAVKNKGISNDSARAILEKNLSGSAFSHLKERLKRDMLNAILWQESAKRFPESYMAASFECSKNIAQGYLLLMRGATSEALKLIQKAQKLAKDHELIGERVQMNQLIRRHLRTITSSKQLQAVNSQIREDLENLVILNQTEEHSTVIAAPHLFKSEAEQPNKHVGESLIKELEAGYDQTGLSRAGFWYLMAATEFHTSNNEHEKALEYGSRFLELVKTSKAIYSKPNMAGVSQTVGVSLLNLRRFESAIQHFNLAVDLFRSGGQNELRSLELLLKAQFAKPSPTGARSTVEKALVHPLVVNNPERFSKWMYYKACVNLLSGDPVDANASLNSTVEIAKSKNELSAYFRVVEIMAMIEVADYDWVEFKFETLRKFLSRNRKLRRPRIVAILSIISSLMRNGFKLSSISKSAKAELANLIEEPETYQWQPEGAEILRFDDWAQRKLT